MSNLLQSGRIKRKVLIVDDELINRELLETILAMNYEVSSVSRGMEALAVLRAEPDAYSLILLDIIMPVMSGFDVIEAVKSDEKLKDIPIIVMTSEKSAEVRSIRMGAADFIAKPYRMPEVILARCERIIAQTEERQLIRSIEKDPVTHLYVKLFFGAYMKRIAPNVKGAMDAVALKIGGLDRIDSHEKRDRIMHKTAELFTENIISTKGIGCRADDALLYAYCRHKDNYEDLIGTILQELQADPDAESVTLHAGIIERPDKSISPQKWFEQASSLCDEAAANGRLTAVSSSSV